MADGKQNMSARADAVNSSKGSDTALLVVAVLVVVAGVAGYYLLPHWMPHLASIVPTAVVVGALVVAGAITWFTATGRKAREFVRETQFEMRKVVWPTRQETLQTTLIVVIVVVLLSIVLGAIDLLLKSVILDWLLKL